MSKYQYLLPQHQVEYGVEIPVNDLKTDPQAQRTLNEKRAQGIADELLLEAVGSIVVSERTTGERFIVDGMHRTRALQLKGIPTVRAEVHKGLSLQEEATLFLIKNRESKGPSAIDEYQIGLTAGLPLFVDTEKVLQAHGLAMGSTSTNTVGAVAGVLRVTDTYGPVILDRALQVAEDGWGRARETWDGMLLGGIGQFLGKHGDVVSDKELATKIAKKGSAQMWIHNVHALSTAGGMHHSGTGGRVSTCYQLVVSVWNKGKTKNKIVL
jgi:hypothetical protein